MRGSSLSRAVVLAVALLWQAASVTGAHGQTSPTISLSPSSGAGGTTVAVRGTGFTAGDTVLVDILGPSQDGESSTLARTTVAQDGSFAATVTIPEGAPPEPITIMAHPLSFGPRSGETVNRAPKATFTVTSAGPSSQQISPGALPRTGTGLVADTTSSKDIGLVVGLLGGIAALGLGVWYRGQVRRTSSR